MWSLNSKPSVDLLPSLLERLEVLLFAGDLDAMCNWLGVNKTIEALEWNGAIGMGNVTVHDWSVNGTQVGSWTTSRNLHWGVPLSSLLFKA
jgi:carboxypeptidase D